MDSLEKNELYMLSGFVGQLRTFEALSGFMKNDIPADDTELLGIFESMRSVASNIVSHYEIDANGLVVGSDMNISNVNTILVGTLTIENRLISYSLDHKTDETDNNVGTILTAMSAYTCIIYNMVLPMKQEQVFSVMESMAALAPKIIDKETDIIMGDVKQNLN